MNEQELIAQKEQIETQLLEIEKAKKAKAFDSLDTESELLRSNLGDGLQVLYPHGKRMTQIREDKLKQIAELIEDITYQKPRIIFINPSKVDSNSIWNVVIQLKQL